MRTVTSTECDPPLPAAMASSRRRWLAGAALALLAGAVGAAGWWLAMRQSPPDSPAAALRRETLAGVRAFVRRHAGRPEAMELLAAACYEFHETEESERQWRRSLAFDDRRVQPYIGLARLAMDRGDYAQADAHYREALDRDGANDDARFGRSEALYHLGRLDEAARMLGDVDPHRLESFPDLVLLGQIDAERRQYARAEASFRAAAALAPASPQPYYGLSQVCARTGKRQEAAGHARRFRELSAAEVRAAGRATGEAADLLATHRSAAAVLAAAAQVSASLGDSEQADYFWQRAIELTPQTAAGGMAR